DVRFLPAVGRCRERARDGRPHDRFSRVDHAGGGRGGLRRARRGIDPDSAGRGRCNVSGKATTMRITLIAALAALCIASGYAQQKPAANRDIYLYQGQDRAERLVSEAKREGTVVL